MTQPIDGQNYTWLARDGKPGLLYPVYQFTTLAEGNTPATVDDLRGIVNRKRDASPREERASSILGHRDHVDYVLGRLEVLFLDAIVTEFAARDYDTRSPTVQLPTSVEIAKNWLFGFYRQTRLALPSTGTGFPPPYSKFNYSIGANEFGETLHIFACRTLLQTYKPPGGEDAHKPKLGWSSGGGDADATTRLNSLLGPASPVPDGNPAKGDINRYLLGPMLIDAPLAGHAKILNALLSDRHTDIGTALRVYVQKQLKTEQADKPAVGIWIRSSKSNPTTNTTAARVEQMISAAQGERIMLLGDSPDAALRKVITQKTKNSSVIEVNDLGKADWLRNAQGGGTVLYQSQASALVHLYRDYGLYCILGNKSGGMDLPAFASIPSIQFSPDPVTRQAERIYQRLVFTSLCSPFWRIINVHDGSDAPNASQLANAIAAARDTKALERRHGSQQ